MEGAGAVGGCQGREGGMGMLSWDNGPRRAGARCWYPARRLHLVDIENLAGDALPSLSQIREAQGLYAGCLGFRVRSGPDGADLALLDVLRHENVARRFTHVAIGSGDHVFAEAAADLADQGVWVTVVSRHRSLSPRLAMAARQVIFLDTAPKAA